MKLKAQVFEGRSPSSAQWPLLINYFLFLLDLVLTLVKLRPTLLLYLGSSLVQSRQNLGTNVPGWEEHKEDPYNLGNALAPRCSVNGVVTFKPESYVERNDAGVVEMLCA